MNKITIGSVFSYVLAFVTGATLSLAAALPASAQEMTIEEIVVTARKRTENLQDVPLSITAISSETLQRASVYDLADLAEVTPGLTYQKVGSISTPTIRGLAQTDQSGLLGNVGVFLDGVFLNNRSSFDFGVLDLERIEVVKGPQSALYGRNTFAGAINYVTKAPSFESFEGRVTAEVGSDGRREIGGSVNFPLGDRAAIRAFANTSEFEGTIRNVRGGENLGGYDDRTAYGISLRFDPTDDLRFRLSSFRNELEEDQSPLVQLSFLNNNCGTRYDLETGPLWTLFCGDLAAAAAAGPNLDSLGFGQDGDLTVSYLDVEYDFPFATLSVNYATTEANYFTFFDNVSDPNAVNVPFGPTGIFSAQFFTNSGGDAAEQDSLELRLTSNDDGALSWMVGASWYDTQTGGIINSIARLLANPDQLGRITRVADRQDTDTLAVYGSLGYAFNDRHRLTGEIRYTEEDVTLDSEITIDFIPGFPNIVSSSSTDFDYVTPRITYEYDWSDNVMLYASAAKGVKSGGINRGVTDPRFLSYEPEENWTYELGAKSTVLDGRGNFNITLFHVDWTDLQNRAPASIVAGAAIINADEATSTGVELDFRYRPIDNLELRSALAVLEPEFGSGVTDASVGAICGETASVPPAVACSSDVSGNQLPRTSDLQVYLGATYTLPQLIGDFDGYIRADASHQAGKYNLSLNEVDQGDINLLNLRLGLVNERYEVALWAENVLDEEYIARATTITDPVAGFLCAGCGITRQDVFPGNGRTYGLRFNANF